MFQGIYSAASGEVALMAQQDLIAQNIASLGVAGYRQANLIFQGIGRFPDLPPTPNHAPPQENDQARASGGSLSDGMGGFLGTMTAGLVLNNGAGPLEQTGRPTDFALIGNGYFVVDGPLGTLLTRNGVFTTDANGQLTTEAGYLVQGTDGPITLKPNLKQLTMDADGTLRGDGQPLTKLRIERPAQGQSLEIVQGAYYRLGLALGDGINSLSTVGIPPKATGTQPWAGVTSETTSKGATVPPKEFKVVQGYREGSNVEAVSELVVMIQALRAYEASTRTQRTISEAVGLLTRPGGF